MAATRKTLRLPEKLFCSLRWAQPYPLPQPPACTPVILIRGIQSSEYPPSINTKILYFEWASAALCSASALPGRFFVLDQHISYLSYVFWTVLYFSVLHFLFPYFHCCHIKLHRRTACVVITSNTWSWWAEMIRNWRDPLIRTNTHCGGYIRLTTDVDNQWPTAATVHRLLFFPALLRGCVTRG